MKQQLEAAVADEQSSVRETKKDLQAKIQEENDKEERLLDLATEGLLSKDKIRERMLAISIHRGALQEKLANIDTSLDLGFRTMHHVFALLQSVSRYYDLATDEMRRTVNKTFVEKFLVNEDNDTSILVAEPFRQFYAAQTTQNALRQGKSAETTNLARTR